MTIKVNINSLFFSMFFLLMCVADLFANVLPEAFGYADEIVALMCLLLLLIKGYYKKANIKGFCTGMIFIVLLGLLGNIFGTTQNHFKPVLIDVFMFLKPYIIFVFVRATLSEKTSKSLYSFVEMTSKVALFVLACLAIISIRFGMGMVDISGTFKLYNGYYGTVSWWTILFFAVVYGRSKNNRFAYFVMSTIIILRSKSGLGFFALVLAVMVYLFFERQKKFKWYYILAIVPLCFYFGRNEITEYLINDKSPRYILFYYAFVTASKFFPLGAGFATYGSMQSIQNYSKLYTKYGFNSIYGMTKKYHQYLMDSYYPQIIGQMGFIGFGIYVIFLYKIIKNIILSIKNKTMRCACLYLFVCWIVAGLGFGTASLWGCTVFFLIPVFYAKGNQLAGE